MFLNFILYVFICTRPRSHSCFNQFLGIFNSFLSLFDNWSSWIRLNRSIGHIIPKRSFHFIVLLKLIQNNFLFCLFIKNCKWRYNSSMNFWFQNLIIYYSFFVTFRVCFFYFNRLRFPLFLRFLSRWFYDCCWLLSSMCKFNVWVKQLSFIFWSRFVTRLPKLEPFNSLLDHFMFWLIIKWARYFFFCFLLHYINFQFNFFLSLDLDMLLGNFFYNF